jgi:hypothetical protein
MASLQRTPVAENTLRHALLSGASVGGGWGYYAGNASRLEPTCWALLALGDDELPADDLDRHRQFLLRCQRPDGWLTEDPRGTLHLAGIP